jgi:hypothetical protein
MEIIKRVQAFGGWVRKKTADGQGVWLTIIALLVLALLFAIGKLAGSPAKATPSQRVFTLVADLAGLGITAIVAGAVLKVLVVEGFFTSALMQLFESDAWLAGLAPERRTELWRRLTGKVYIPSLDSDDGKVTPSAGSQNLSLRVSEAITASFAYKAGEYARRVDSDVTVRWEPNSARSRIEITTKARQALVPFDAGRATEWVTTRTAEPHLSLTDYNKSTRDLTINGDKPTAPKTKMIGRTEHTTYVLSGKSEYDIAYTDTISWVLDNDPTLMRTAILVYDGFDVRIDNRAEDLRIVFLEVGGTDLFETTGVQQGANEDLIDFDQVSKRKARRVILPGQGYQLIFVRKTAAGGGAAVPAPNAQPDQAQRKST